MIDPVIQKLIDRLENDYDFESTGGILKNTVEWHGLKGAIAGIFDPENQPSQYGTSLTSPIAAMMVRSLGDMMRAIDMMFESADQETKDKFMPEVERLRAEITGFQKEIK